MREIYAYTYDTLDEALKSGMSLSKRKELMKKACETLTDDFVALLFNYDTPIPQSYITRYPYHQAYKCKTKENFFERLYLELDRYTEGRKNGELPKTYRSDGKPWFSDDIYARDQIYILGFEYRYEYGSVILTSNRIGEFYDTVAKYAKKYPDKYTDCEENRERLESLKYNAGDFNRDRDGRYYTFFVKIDKEGFRNTLLEVLERGESEGLFDRFAKTADFKYDIWEYD
ncbi:MAG: hypothetical protein LBC09_05100 [Helicobacteraceae bacterium]|nr:hypothetical protein [Helicobacteraceae bacterium]